MNARINTYRLSECGPVVVSGGPVEVIDGPVEVTGVTLVVRDCPVEVRRICGSLGCLWGRVWFGED